MLGALRPEIHHAQLVGVINHRPKTLARCRRSVVVNQVELVSSSVEAAVARVQRVARHQQLQPRQGCGEDQQEAVRRCGIGLFGRICLFDMIFLVGMIFGICLFWYF